MVLMRLLRAMQWVVPALAAMAVGCASISAGVGGPHIGVGVTVSRSEVRALVERINRHRAARGCRALRWDDRLAAVARRHSDDMAKRRFFDHTNPDGRDPFDRLRSAGIHCRAAAENIAYGQYRGRDVYDDWIASEGHRDNIENCEYTSFGIGLYERRWTLLLARY